jgi:hypothetical protein
MEVVNMLKVSISKGNKKMGEIKSVSLPPVVTCAKNCTCAKKCYAMKMCRIYKNVKASYDRNLEILENNPDEYWSQVEDAICTSRFFRMHVSGDIPNYEYLIDMVTVANTFPHCDILVFTKKYNLVNTFLDNGGAIPNNLHLIFSEWEGMAMDNKYNLPVAHVIFKGEQPKENWNICSGNCLECAKKNINCWSLKNGEHVAFHEH